MRVMRCRFEVILFSPQKVERLVDLTRVKFLFYFFLIDHEFLLHSLVHKLRPPRDCASTLLIGRSRKVGFWLDAARLVRHISGPLLVDH
jgi:hypothetical protein